MAVRGLMCLHLPCLSWSPLTPFLPQPNPSLALCKAGASKPCLQSLLGTISAPKCAESGERPSLG